MKKQYKYPYCFIVGNEYYCLTSETSLLHITGTAAKNSFAIANYQGKEKIRKILKSIKKEIKIIEFREYLTKSFFEFLQRIPGQNECLMVTTKQTEIQKNGKTI